MRITATNPQQRVAKRVVRVLLCRGPRRRLPGQERDVVVWPGSRDFNDENRLSDLLGAFFRLWFKFSHAPWVACCVVLFSGSADTVTSRISNDDG